MSTRRMRRNSDSDTEMADVAPLGPELDVTATAAPTEQGAAAAAAAALDAAAAAAAVADVHGADSAPSSEASSEVSSEDDDEVEWEAADEDTRQRLIGEAFEQQDAAVAAEHRYVDTEDELETDDDPWQQQSGESDDEGEEEADAEELFSQNAVLRVLFGGRGGRGTRRIPADLVKLPVPIFPLKGDLAASINGDTSAFDVGQYNAVWPCLDSGFDSHAVPILTTEKLRQLLHEQQQPTQPHTHSNDHKRDAAAAAAVAPHASSSSGSGGGLEGLLQSAAARISAATTGRITRSTSQRAAATTAEPPAGPEPEPAATTAVGGASSSRSSSEFDTGFRLVNSTQLLLKREVSIGRQQGFSRRQQRQLCCHRGLPLHPQQARDSMHSRAYIGQYSASGDFFIAAYQDRRVRLYDTHRNWKLRKDVTTRMTRWTITDTCLSPDQRLLVYASISPVAFVVHVGSSYDVVESLANVTELHEPLAVDGSMAPGASNDHAHGRFDGGDEGAWRGRDFGIWSIAWSPQGGQLIAGTNDSSVYVYDIESKRCLSRLTGHSDDVNAVAYLHGDSSSSGNPHLLVSGSDDHMVRVWDIRDKTGRTLRQPQGVLVGHTEGLTHVCPKGDGIHLISNSKDQTVKLWDIRAAVSASKANEAARQRPQIAHWDYRWEDYPAAGYDVVHPQDVSLMTYRGHAVLQTLIRAYFSPMHTTGQRYIYAGSARGTIIAWDVVSGEPVAKFEHHRSLVRDCSWHPYEAEFATVSWEGRVITWGVQPPEKQPPADRGDIGRYY